MSQADTATPDTATPDTATPDTATPDTAAQGPAPGRGGDAVRRLEQEGDIAADYVERLLDLLDYDGDIDLDVEADRALVAVVGTDLDRLVGERGETLEALQELVRLAVHQRTGERTRLMLDVGGWRARRRRELTDLGLRTAREVVASGERRPLRPMSPFERKVVHDAVASVDGAASESEGEGEDRRVVVLPDA